MYTPLEIELIEIAGFRASPRAARLPRRSKSDSDAPGVLGDGDKDLMSRLVLAGDSHAKSARGIEAWIEITCGAAWLIEFETYVIGTGLLGEVQNLSTSSTMRGLLGAGLRGVELAEAKQAMLPEVTYTRSVKVSYQALRRMYMERRSHPHPDWGIFCKFVENLPYFSDLIAPETRYRKETRNDER